jgi:Tol biopolymer transport system component/DNA-binding winged helix-turn-helix (wHTH) protein
LKVRTASSPKALKMNLGKYGLIRPECLLSFSDCRKLSTMGPKPNSQRRIFFGPFEYDSSSGELRKHGTRLRLTGQPLQILEVLLERPNEAIGRDELQQRLWNGTTFVDFEHGLNAAINKLRQTLGDSADQPRYIETLPGRGYRFISPLRNSSPGNVLEMVAPAFTQQVIDQTPRDEARVTPALPPPNTVPTQNLRFTTLTWAIIGVALLAVFILVLRSNRLRSLSLSPSVQTMRFRIAIPEAIRLSASQTFSLSPDGRTLAYLGAAADGGQQLWIQSLGSLEPRMLPGAVGGSDAPVFWSPDSKFVAFYRDEALRRIDLSGNPSQVICEVPSLVLGGSWNREGTIIFGTETNGIMRVDGKNGKAVPLAQRDATRGERVLAWPTLLPDGRHFLYSRLSSVAANNGVFVGSLDSKPGEQSLKRLIETPFAAQFVRSKDGNGAVLFLRETTLWAQDFDASRQQLTGDPWQVAEHIGSSRAFGFFASSSSGALVHRIAPPANRRTAWFDRRGRQLSFVGQSYDLWDEPPRISPDGTRMALTQFDKAGNVDLWVHDFGRDVTQRITFDPAIDSTPVWSPDGTSIAFSSSRRGHYDLYRIGANGAGREELLYSSNENKIATSWSADGRFLLYSTPAGGVNQAIWILPMEGKNNPTPIPLMRTQSNEFSGTFSPDDRWIAYVSNETGIAEVYVRSFSAPSTSGASPGEVKMLISRQGGRGPYWRADGRELFYIAPYDTLMSVAVTPGTNLRPSVPQPLFQARPAWFASATSDGNRFLMAVPAEQISSNGFTVILNWQSELSGKN